MTGQPDQPNRPPGATAAGLGVLLLAVVCCAGPLLLSAGLLASVGGLLRIPPLLVAAALAVAGARRAAAAPPGPDGRGPLPAGQPGSRHLARRSHTRGGPTGPAWWSATPWHHLRVPGPVAASRVRPAHTRQAAGTME